MRLTLPFGWQPSCRDATWRPYRRSPSTCAPGCPWETRAARRDRDASARSWPWRSPGCAVAGRGRATMRHTASSGPCSEDWWSSLRACVSLEQTCWWVSRSDAQPPAIRHCLVAIPQRTNDQHQTRERERETARWGVPQQHERELWWQHSGPRHQREPHAPW